MGATGWSRRNYRDRSARRHSRLRADPECDAATAKFAFGGPDNQYVYFESAISGNSGASKRPIQAWSTKAVFVCRHNHEPVVVAVEDAQVEFEHKAVIAA